MSSLIRTNAPAATLLIRVMVGGIFLSEGIQKFFYLDQLASGRFERIGIPAPEIMGPFVATVECTCGLMILFGLLTRLAAIPLIITMCVAILTTKIPILLETEFLGFSLRSLGRYGFWSMLHEARTDLCLLLGSLFLLISGGGRISIDHLLSRANSKEEQGPGVKRQPPQVGE